MKGALTLDSSVFIAAFRPGEPRHPECLQLLELVIESTYQIGSPLANLSQVVG